MDEFYLATFQQGIEVNRDIGWNEGSVYLKSVMRKLLLSSLRNLSNSHSYIVIVTFLHGILTD